MYFVRESEAETDQEEEVQERDMGPPDEIIAAMADMQAREDLPKPAGEALMQEFFCPITHVIFLPMTSYCSCFVCYARFMFP